ncbi:MAG: HAD hydrolase-like protein [Rhodospirillaceae bacterium]
MGGTVINRGKPDPAVYYLALEMLDLGPEAKVAVIGDGLHTDMPGAEASGLDGILVTGGLNAQPLGIRHGEKADPAKVATLMAKHGLSPVAMIPAFVW